MRIISGEWRGRPIDAPRGQATRPTSDRAREALFSMLASRLGSFEGLRVADLFAGSGALGLDEGAHHRARQRARALQMEAAAGGGEQHGGKHRCVDATAGCEIA